MLKRFFISMLGTIAGFWISIIIGFFAILAIIGAAVAAGSDSKPKVDKNSILYIKLSGNIPERYQSGDVWQMLSQADDDAEALDNILNAIRLAADDSKIDGIYIDGVGATAGMASREEIVEALREFKQSDKWIYAYADAWGQGDYMLASLADSLFVNPMGAVAIHGMATETPFLKGFLDKIGVKMQIVRVGTFKSAVEPLMGTEMSPASRLQTQVMLDSMWNVYCQTVSAGRKVAKSEIDTWADSIMTTWTASRDKKVNAVDALVYRRSVAELLADKVGADSADDLPLITPSEYMAAQKTASATKKHVALLYAVGDIVDSGDGGIVGETMVPEILSLADDDNVEGLVMRVNSGGGSAFASEQIWEALEYFKSKDKPFYVSMGDYAASGGYYISCGADYIYADRTTLTGSIGVFGVIPDFSGLATDKLGITFGVVQTNANATFPSVMTGMPQQQLDALQRSVETTYDTFTRRVADGRKMPQDSVKAIAEGRVWTGGAALELGLVDRIGSLHTVVAAMCEVCGLDEDRVVAYPQTEEEVWAQFIKEAKKNMSAGSVKIDARFANILRMLDRLNTMNPVQARMPEIIVR